MRCGRLAERDLDGHDRVRRATAVPRIEIVATTIRRLWVSGSLTSTIAKITSTAKNRGLARGTIGTPRFIFRAFNHAHGIKGRLQSW